MDVGDVIGGYRLEAIIGRGGMGIVYRARQVSLDREVALKILAPEFAGDESFRVRFIREAQLAATIEHPNAITVYEASEAEGMLFIAMRYIDGPDLRAVIDQQSPLAATRVTDIIAQVAAALDVAHERGLIHRDIKPANVLLDEHDHAYLTDFGLAKRGVESPGLTQEGLFVGTIDYVAPEQIFGGPVDARSDHYALGALLYTALTRQPPFVRESEVATLFAHVNDPPPAVTALRPDLPAAFDAVVARAMAKQPADRYATAGELARAAVAAAAGAPLPTPVPTAAPELGTPAAARIVDTSPEIEPPTPIWEASKTPWGSSPTMYESPPPASPSATGYGWTPPPSPPIPKSRARFSFPRLRLPGIRWRRKEVAGRTLPPGMLVEPLPPLPPMLGGVRFKLRPRFSYVHHPLASDEPLIPLLGNEAAIDALADRIEHSRGGSFLVTGFRGVGKSTVVLRAVHGVRAIGAEQVVHVNLNVARPREPTELMFEVIRRLFEALDDARAFGNLSPEVHERLLMAYQRTLLTFKETRQDARERNRGLSVAMSGLPLAPKVDLSGKSSESLATETSFLGYTEGDVEQDFVRVVRLIREGGLRSETDNEKVLAVRKVVVVFDELDKLADNEGASCIELLLRTLKNLFTTANVHFIFVAGPELHDAALLDSHRGNSVYESVFAWQLYVPCVWNAADKLLRATVADPESNPATLEELAHYLRFKARGVPRLLLKELNEFVAWHGAQACIELRGPDLAKVIFYAGIDRILDEFVRPGGVTPAFGVPIDGDRWMIGAYYLTDAILRTRGDSFTALSLVNEGAGRGLEAVSERKVTTLLDYFATHGVLEIVHGKNAASTYYEDTPDAQTVVYRLSDDIVAKLSAFARVDERERADLGPAMALSSPWVDTEAPGAVVAERYELLEEIDRGGMGRVYRARDRRSGDELAIKLLDVPELASSPAMAARFRRKAKIALEVQHPNVVRTIDTITQEGVPGIVMQLVHGTPLRRLIDQVRIAPPDAALIMLRLLDALEYLFERGIVRCDLKPTGIMIEPDLNPVILDLGIAKRLRSDEPQMDATGATQAGVAVGTPAYAAPEQLLGNSVDVRSDLFALAAIMVEMISGRPPRGEGDMFDVLARAAKEDIAVEKLAVSPELRSVLRVALARDPNARYPTPAAMRAALAAAPEVQPAAAVPG